MTINEIREIPNEVQQVQEVPSEMMEYSSLKDVWNEFTTSIREYAESIVDTLDMTPEAMDAREYGVNECAEIVKDVFTPEVIQEWGNMSLEQRNEITQEYATGIGEALNIDFKGVIWEQMDNMYGYNQGDGYVHINIGLLANPAELMNVVDTIAHEARHQLQVEAIRNPEMFPFDEATINEWTVAQMTYTTEYPTSYDPWGYTYNPMELDSRYFGESMVRELTKDLINNA